MANARYQGITLDIGGDSTGLSKALREPQREASNLQRQLNNVNSALKLDPGNTDLLAQKQRILADSVTNTEKKLALLKQAQKEFVDSGGDITSEGYVQLQTEIVKTEAKLKSLNDSQSGLSASLESFTVKLDSVGNKATQMGDKVQKASLLAAGGLGIAAKSAIDFESAWTGVVKTVDGTPEQLEEIRQGILDLSTVSGTSAGEIAGVAEAAGQLGIKTEDVLEFTETMVMLGDATNMSAEEAATSLAKFANITGMSADNYERLGSTITYLGNNFATTEGDITAMSTRLASAGKLAGLTETEILALAASMSSVGIEAEAGGTAMTQTLTAMESAVAEGGESLDQFARVAGMTSTEFADAWNNDPMTAIQAFISGLGGLEEQGESATLVLDEMGLSGVRQSNMLKSLALSSDNMSQAVKDANVAWDENTALSEEANKRWETTERKLQGLLNSFLEFAIILGEILLPVLNIIIDGLKTFATWLTNLDPTIQTIIVGLLAFVAALSPVLKIFGSVTRGFSNLIKFGGKVAKLFSANGAIGKAFIALKGVVSKAIAGISTALKGLFTLITTHPVIAAITAIIAIVVLLYTNCEWFRDAVHDVIDAVIGFFSDLFDGAVEFIGGVIDFVKNNWKGLLLFLVNPIAGAFKLIYDNCEGFRNFIDNLVKTVVKFIKDRVNDVVKFFTKTIPETINNIIKWFQKLPYYIGYVIGIVIGFILNLGIKLFEFVTITIPDFILGVINWFGQLPGKIGAFVSEVLINVMTWVVDMGVQAYEVGSEFISGIVTWFSQLPGKVWDFISDTFNKVSAWAGEMANKAIKVGSDFINGIVTWFQQLPGKVWGFLSDVVNKVITWGGNMATQAWNAAVNTYNNIANKIGELPAKMIEIGKAIVEGIWDGIVAMADWLGDQIGGFCGGIWDGITDFFGINSPSRLMRDTVGVFLPPGISDGFEKAMPKAEKNILSSLGGTVSSIQEVVDDALDFEASKNISLNTMTTHNEEIYGSMLNSVKDNILGTVETMLGTINLETQFVLDGKTIATETVPLINKELGRKARKDGR